MKTINLVRQEKSDIDYKIIHFPDGEDHIVLDEMDRKEDYSIECRVCNPNDLFILAQVADILDRQGVVYTINIYYLMSMRMDRVISYNESFSLQLVCNILNDFIECRGIFILEPHSYRTLGELDLGKNMINTAYNDIIGNSVYNNIFVFPDNGAYDRYGSNIFCDQEFIICKKSRDPKTGKLLSFNIEEDTSESESPLLIIDDLCDGGGTFVGVAKLLREKYPNRKLSIYVTHMVNPKGIKNLADNYDEVIFTNSYKDWQNELLPSNVKVIEVI